MELAGGVKRSIKKVFAGIFLMVFVRDERVTGEERINKMITFVHVCFSFYF